MNYNFLSDRLEVRNKDRKYWVRAYATLLGEDIDSKKSIITQRAKDQFLNDMKRFDIAVDVEHDAVATGRPNLLPIGKIRAGAWDNTGLITDIEVNPNSPQFSSTWNSLKDGFLDALSVEFIPKQVKEEFINGEWIKIIDEVELHGMAFTGRSATRGSNILEVFTRSINEFKTEKIDKEMNEVKNMVEEKIENKVEEKVETKIEEAKPVEEKVVEKVIEKEVIPDSIKKELEEQKKKIEELQEAKVKEEKASVNAQSVVSPEDKYGQQQTGEEVTKPIAEQLDEKPLADLMKEAIESDAYSHKK